MEATGRAIMSDRQYEFFLELADDWGVTITSNDADDNRFIIMSGPDVSIRHLQGVLLGLWLAHLGK